LSLEKKRALTIIASWLEAAAIPFKITGGDSLVVEGKEREFPFQIASGVPTTGSTICASDLTAPIGKALDTFWAITEKTGFGRPQVVKRGVAPGAVRFGDDPELVAMRHREFRQVANLPAHIYKDPNYQKIITWYCIRFFRSNASLCSQIGYEIEDIKTYAWLYLTNFYGRWRHIDAKVGDNGKMFCSYLQQRLYSDLKPLLIRKSRNIVVDIETAELGMNVEFRDQYESHDGKERSTPVAVALGQDRDLEQEMEGLSHDRLVEILDQLETDGVRGVIRFRDDHRRECMDGCNDRSDCEDNFTPSSVSEKVRIQA